MQDPGNKVTIVFIRRVMVIILLHGLLQSFATVPPLSQDPLLSKPCEKRVISGGI